MNIGNIVETSRCYWLTGLSGAGKTTLARKFADQLRRRSISVLIMDGDILRARLNQDLGFSREDRAESVRLAAEISRIAVDSGLTVIASLVSPYAKDRQAARTVWICRYESSGRPVIRRRPMWSAIVGERLNLTPRGCGQIPGLIYAVIPRLCRYSIGLRDPSETLIRFALYQRIYESTTSMN